MEQIYLLKNGKSMININLKYDSHHLLEACSRPISPKKERELNIAV